MPGVVYTFIFYLSLSSSVMSTHQDIVVLGASFAGISTAHYVLKHVIPTLPKEGNYRLTLVSPTDEFYYRVGAPRVVINATDLPYEKVFKSVTEGFKQYGSQFNFVHGAATAWDTAARNITVQLSEGGAAYTLPYLALVVATGVKTYSPLFSAGERPDATRAAITAFRNALPKAKSIIIAGGGPAGVETAGEIGEFLNGSAGMFSSRPANPKATITVVTADDKLLPILRPALAKQAEIMLNKFGVDVVYSKKVTKVEPEGAGYDLDKVATGPVTVSLSTGEKLEADLYIPAHGVRPNTEWVPPSLLNARGYIEANAKTSRVEIAGERVYVVGDVAGFARGGILDINNSVPIMSAVLKRDLLDAGKNQPALKEITMNTGESQFVVIGKSKGVGAFNGMKFPSFIVSLIKGRDYLVGNSYGLLDGSNFKKEAK